MTLPNPPITMGRFVNVPDEGSEIRHEWMQDITQAVLDLEAGGGGTDEVWIGTDDPIATVPSIELWVDADEPDVMTDDMRWNTAWGVVAVGSFISSGSATVPDGTAFTNVLSFTPLVGRRYCARVRSRASQSTVATPSGSWIVLRRDGGTWCDSHTYWNSYFVSPSLEAFFDGDGVAHTYQAFMTGNPATAWTMHLDQVSSHFYIEDVGPVSSAVPAINPTPAWTAMGTLTNGWVAGNPAPAYRKLGDMVQFKGNINRSTALVAPTTSYFGNLPVGYRPPVAIKPPCMSVGSDNWGAASILVVAANGDVAVIKTAQSPSNPHSGTQWEFQFSVTP